MLKTVSSVVNAIGALNYKGTWNASTNSPTLTSGVGTKGDYYVVSVAGSTNLDGETLWGVGDWAAFNGSAWQKVDGGDSGNFVNISVSSLTGYMYGNGTSNVTASTTIPVANVTGAVSSVTGTAPIASSGGTTPAISIPAATTSVSGYLTSTDWNTFNAKGSGNGTVTSVATGTGLTGGPITSTGTVSLASTAVTIGTYGGATNVASFTVDQQGRLTSASNVTIAIGNSNLQNSNVVIGNTTIALGGTTANLGNVTISNVTIIGGTTNASVFNFTGNTTATATYGTASLPLQPAGFMQVNLNGTVVKVPYYAV